MQINSGTLGFDPSAAAHHLRMLIEPGDVFEIRALGVPWANGKGKSPQSCFFMDVEVAVAAMQSNKALAEAEGVYVILNAIDPQLHARRHDRIADMKSGEGTSDGHITRLRWLLVDCDPVRLSKISPTEEEHSASLSMARDISRYMRDAHGWPLPLVLDSDNGTQMTWPVDLPPDDDVLLARCLETLDFMFSDDAVQVDTSTASSAQLARLPGTVNRKGDNVPGRPHRQAKILLAPDDLRPTVVGRAQLEALSPMMPKFEEPVSPVRTGSGSFDLESWIAAHLPDAIGPRDWRGGTLWKVPQCPWNSDHAWSACVGQFANGAVFASCRHNSCQHLGWPDLRLLLEPGFSRTSSHRAGHHAGEAHEQPGAALRTVPLSDVEPEQVEWLWFPYVPYGKVTLIAGDPGLGKTYLLNDLAARTSVGGETPDRLSRIDQASVIIMSAEDGIADTIRLRIGAQGGDASCIHAIESVVEPDGKERLVSLGTDIERISTLIFETGARLVIIDPINAYIGKIDGHRDSEVR